MAEPNNGEPKVVMRKAVDPVPENFQTLFPRSINGMSRSERIEKTAQPMTSPVDSFQGGFNYSSNIYRSPTRRFYSPDMTTSSIYLPRDNKMKNLWRRWIASFDPLVGAVLEYYTEMPWGHAEVALDDPFIKKCYEDSIQDSNFFLKCQQIDQEYLKIGEAILVFNFDNSKGYINHIVIQNPDFIDIKGSPLVGDQPDIFLIPDNELRKIITSTDPRIREKKKYISREIVESVMYGRNIRLNNENTLHLARRSNPTDIRGTSIIDRLFKLYMLEDKLIEGTLSAVDNHMFPLKLWKLGNPSTNWIPPESHSRALAEMLQQQQFDPNFAIIYHHAISYEQHGMEGKVMKWDTMFERVDKLKMIALGINNAFLTGDTTFASASAFLNVMFSRLRSKRDMYEQTWMHKYFKIIAEKNEFFKRDKKEIVGHFRVGSKKSELVLPKLIWNKSLSIREDQAYLAWLKEVWDKNKGPLSLTTLLGAAGLEFEHELKNKKQEKIVEQQIGQMMIEEEATGAKGGEPGGAGGGLFGASFKGKRDKIGDDENDSKFLTGTYPTESVDKKQSNTEDNITKYNQKTIDDDLFLNIVDTYDVEREVKNSMRDIIKVEDVKPIIASLYEEGKLRSYNSTNYLDIKLKMAHLMTSEDDNESFLMDVNDDIMIEDMNMMIENNYDKKRMALDAYFMGQLQGLYEQGINVVGLRYASDSSPWQGKKIEIKELLNSNKDWSNTLYPNFELVYAEPQIANFDNDISEGMNTIETNMFGKTLVENMPIEYKSCMDKIVAVLPQQIKKLSFVNKITDIPEWMESRKKYYAEEVLKDSQSEEDKKYNEPLIMNMMQRDIKNNRDKLFAYGNTIYVDYTMGQKDGLFENIFYDEFSNYILKNDKIKEALANDYSSDLENKKTVLTNDDIEFLNAEQYIFPIQDKTSNKIVGWQINKEKKIDETMLFSDLIKEAQLVNGKWNTKGEPLYNIKNISNMNKYLIEEMKKSARDSKKTKILDRVYKLV